MKAEGIGSGGCKMKKVRYYVGNGIFLIAILLAIVAVLFAIISSIKNPASMLTYTITFCVGLFYGVFGYGAKMLIVPKDMQ